MEDQKPKSTHPSSFISANSAHGFYSLYDEVFSVKDFDRIFVIAGGPGTGKSTLMRRISGQARESGAKCEEILCSSDPSSLDGVILEANGKRVGIMDGTPPHPRTVTAPGYVEELCALGRFWDSEGLQKQRGVIEAANEKKRRAFLSAYQYLGAMGSIRKEEHLERTYSFDKDKAARQIKHKIHLLRSEGACKRRFLRAFSTLGETVLPFARTDLDGVLLISGREASAEIYLSLFAELLKEKGIAFTQYLSPLCPEFTEAVYLSESKTLLIKEKLYTGTAKARRVVADRFFPLIENDQKDKATLYAELKRLALGELARAGKAHAVLEEIYKSKMNFDALQAESKLLCRRVLASLSL